MSMVVFSNSVFYAQRKGKNTQEHLFQLYESTVARGERNIKDGNFLCAVEAFTHALNIAKKVSKVEAEIECLMNLGLLNWNVGQIEKSVDFYERAFGKAKRMNSAEKVEKCKIILEISDSYLEGKKLQRCGRYRKSIESFGNAIDLSKKIKSKEHMLKCLRKLSISYFYLYELQKFNSLNEKALRIARILNHKKEEGRCLNNIGLYNCKLNKYSKALCLYQEALLIEREVNNKEDESACLNNIGVIYGKVGLYDRALDYLRTALKIDKELDEDRFVSIELLNIGEIFCKRGILLANKKDFYRALDYFMRGLKLIKKSKNERCHIRILNNMGYVYLELKEYHEALRYFQSSYRKALKIQDREVICMSLNNIGIVNLNLGNHGDSRNFFSKAIDSALKIGVNHILWESYFGLGQVYEDENNFCEALENYEKAAEVVEKIMNDIYLDTSKIGFARDKLEIYERIIHVLYGLNCGSRSEAFEKDIFFVIERARARAFLEILRESKVNIREKLKPGLKKKEEEISAKISTIHKILLDENLSVGKRKELLKLLRQRENEYGLLLSKIKDEIPELAEIIAPEPFKLEQVQERLLDEKTALLEFFMCDENSFLFLIKNDGYEMFILPSREEIQDSIRAYLKILTCPSKGSFKGASAAKRLFKELLFPAMRDIPDSVENIIIVPDGILFYLPFETLIQSSKDKFNDYLIMKYKISYAPSSSSLIFLQEKIKRNDHPKDLLIFGDPDYCSLKQNDVRGTVKILQEFYQNQGFDFSPLPHSKKEVRNISRYFLNDQCDVYLGDEAREDVVKKLPLEKYKIIHFACHGFLNERFPSRSALVMSLGNNAREDGFLQFSEICNLRLDADLVVLSACQTGKGRLEKGEGIIGFPRVFFLSGAKSVVSTLWKISDKPTSKFMNYFYRYLHSGYTKAQALRLAKIEMIKSKYFHPFYWAAFILNGEYSSKLN